MNTPPRLLEVLLCDAPATEGEAAVRALERCAAPVAARTAEGAQELARALRTPLDLVLLWDLPDGPDGGEALALMHRLAHCPPVIVVTTPERDGRALALVASGAAAIVHRDRLAPLGAIGRSARALARQRMLVDLARAGAHELNNLVAPIPLATRILIDSVKNPMDADLLATVEVSVGRATAEVDSFYRSALWTAGDMDERSAPAPVRHLIEIVGRTLRDALPALRVETDYPPDLPPAAAPADVVHQIVFCLALNAAGEFGGEGLGAEDRRTVSLAGEEGSGGAEVVVLVRPGGRPAESVLDPLRAAAARLGGHLEYVGPDGPDGPAGGSAAAGGYRLRLPAAALSRPARA